MAKFKMELPSELISQFNTLRIQSPKMFEEMVQAGADVVYNNVIKNMKGSFNDANKLIPYLKITKTYRTMSDDGINNKVGFYGYYKEGERTFNYHAHQEETEAFEYKTGKKHKATRTGGRKEADYYYSYDGIPVPLIIRAREFGSTVNGAKHEAKKPFFRKSFDKSQIESAMLQVQKKYIKD